MLNRRYNIALGITALFAAATYAAINRHLQLQTLHDVYDPLLSRSPRGITVIYATAQLRFPHMLSDMMDQAGSFTAMRPNVLILGVGLMGGTFLPFLHETAAVFPDANLDIVDMNPKIINAISKSIYTPLHKKVADKVIEHNGNFARFGGPKDAEKAKDSRNHLKELLGRIPPELNTSHIAIFSNFFELHKPPANKYNIIIATKSLCYPLLFNPEFTSSSARGEFFGKYLESLVPKGRMYVDEQTYNEFLYDCIDRSKFSPFIIRHTTSRLGIDLCPEEAVCQPKGMSDCYIGCTAADLRGIPGLEEHGQPLSRIASTENIVVIERVVATGELSVGDSPGGEG